MNEKNTELEYYRIHILPAFENDYRNLKNAYDKAAEKYNQLKEACSNIAAADAQLDVAIEAEGYSETQYGSMFDQLSEVDVDGLSVVLTTLNSDLSSLKEYGSKVETFKEKLKTMFDFTQKEMEIYQKKCDYFNPLIGSADSLVLNIRRALDEGIIPYQYSRLSYEINKYDNELAQLGSFSSGIM